jgi:hypothetical protein
MRHAARASRPRRPTLACLRAPQVTTPEAQPGSQYAVLRCIKFDAGGGEERQMTGQVELFAVSSMDESNVSQH